MSSVGSARSLGRGGGERGRVCVEGQEESQRVGLKERESKGERSTRGSSKSTEGVAGFVSATRFRLKSISMVTLSPLSSNLVDDSELRFA